MQFKNKNIFNFSFYLWNNYSFNKILTPMQVSVLLLPPVYC